LEGVEQADHPFPAISQYIPFCFQVYLLVLLDHLFLFQALDGHRTSRFLLPAQPHLPEGALTDDTEGLEVFFAYFLSFPSQVVHFLLQDVLFGLLGFFEGEVELPYLLLEGFPVLAAFFFLEAVQVVFFLYVPFDLLRFGTGSLADGNLALHILFQLDLSINIDQY
jgi:hypothetical protein